jgi:imidazolonepropionase-like amidohydrolase
MNVWQGMFDEFKGDTAHMIKPILGWVPEEWLQNITIQTPFGSDENKPAYKASFAKMLSMLKLLYDNGILLVAGTDGGEAIALHNELAIYVQAGIPTNEVLKIATYNAALACDLEKTAGSIRKGAQADLILIDGDPSINISDIRRVALVIKNKRLYEPKKLMAAQGMKYYY